MSSNNLRFPKNYFEKQAWQNNFYVCGIDEVGRGCLAGPIVVAAVILPQHTNYSLKDSKILTEDERETAYKWITQKAFYSTAILSHDVIDKINIYQATLFAMKKAFIQLNEILPFKPELIKYLVIDAMPLRLDAVYTHSQLETHYFPYGESISKTIAAASIVAKVTRDHLMEKIDQIIPGFNLAQHKGYGTSEHIDIIKKNGISLIHRKSFLKGINKNEPELAKQQNVFD
jgi:ribonuclease HII